MLKFPFHDPVLIFALVMLIVLVAPLIARKLQLPDIIGLITAGIFFGPHLFGILERDQTIELLGTVGLLYIMFQAGLEIDLFQVKKNKHYTLIFGSFTFFIPLIAGTLAGYYFLNLNFAASILFASMFSSHTLLTFPIVSRMGLAKKRAVTAAIGGTIFTDTLALIILAVIISSNQGELNYIFWIKFISFTSIYTFILIYFLPKISSWFFRHFSSEVGIEDYVFVIAALFISAYFSHIAGLEPIIGAFLAGLALNALIPEQSVLMNRIQFVGNVLFIPFFLISVGMIINPKLLFSNIETLKVSITMIVIALLSKWAAANFFSKIVNFSKTESGIIFGLSVNQAAATLAAVLVGYRVEIFNENILTGTILMIVATCFAGPFITEKNCRKLLLETKDKLDFKRHKKTNRALISLKNPLTANKLIDFALLLSPKNSHEPLYPLNIAIEGASVQEEVIKGENLLTKAVTRINSANKTAFPLTNIDINIQSALIKTVKEYRISKVIFGWNENISYKHHLFSNAVEQYIKQSYEMIFVVSIVKPINIVNRILLIIPPLIEKQNGFSDTITELKHLTLTINSELLILSEKNAFDEIQNILTSGKPSVKSDFQEIKSWKNICHTIKEIIKPADMIIQMIARPGRLAWRLSFDKMPNDLKINFPENNIITVYPYYNIDEYDYEKNYLMNELTLLKIIPEQNFYFNFNSAEPVDFFNRIIKDRYFKYPAVILKQLITAMTAPIELTAEITLVHIHTDEIDDYAVFIAVNKNLFKINKIDSSLKIIFVLLSSTKQSTESHLRILSEIARMVQVKKFTENILNASDYNQFLENLKIVEADDKI